MDNNERKSTIKEDYDRHFQKLMEINKMDHLLNSKLFKVFKVFIKYGYYAPFYVSDKVIEAYYLRKDYFPKDIKEITVPPKVQADSKIVNEFTDTDERIKKIIEEFIDLMENHFPEELRTYFYRNINSLNIQIEQIKENDMKDEKVFGEYKIPQNTIVLEKSSDKSTVFHELFHLASSYNDPVTKTCYSGFSQNGFGRAINEGYTQLLTSKYTKDDTLSYYVESLAAWLIERLIGNKMALDYFSANLDDLINELSDFKPKEDVIRFIQYLDFNLRYDGNKVLIPTKDKKLENAQRFIGGFITDLYSEKLKNDFHDIVADNISISYNVFKTKIHYDFWCLNFYGLIDSDVIARIDSDFDSFILEKTGHTIKCDETGNLKINDLEKGSY